MRRTMRVFAGVLLLGLVAGCGSSPSPKAGPAATASLQVRLVAASVEKAGTTTFGAGHTGQSLAAGDTVSTDASGFAEIDYPDGSLARLDANSSLTVTSLSDAQRVQRVVTKLKSGQLWNRVKAVTSSQGRYEVDTAYADATVRDPAFIVDCRATSSCTFTVFQGSITVTPAAGGTSVVLRAGQRLTATSAGLGPVNTPRKDTLLTNAFLSSNLTIDGPNSKDSIGARYLVAANVLNSVVTTSNKALRQAHSLAQAAAALAPEATAELQFATALKPLTAGASGKLATQLSALIQSSHQLANLFHSVGHLSVAQFDSRNNALNHVHLPLVLAIRRELGLPPPPQP